MWDLSLSPFLAPGQLSYGALPPASLSAASPLNSSSSFTDVMRDESQEFGSVLCSPPRQSFQLLLRGGEELMIKDEFELLSPPRRVSSRTSSSSSASLGLPPRSASSPASAVASAKRAKRGAKVRATTPGLPVQNKKRPKRKASYLARKEEKEALLTHLEELQSQLNSLKYQAVVHGGYRAQTQARKRLTKNILVEAVQKHQLAVAGLQAMLSSYSSLQEHSPIEVTIRLGLNMATRRETLLQFKGPKLREAERYIAERSRGLDELKTYSEEERFETPGGDFCSLRFDVIPVRGARSARAVFDAMLFYINNIEISISETLGHITIREDDDSSDASISHHRLVTRVSASIQTESNTVIFSEFSEGGNSQEVADGEECGAKENGFGIITSDFVDDDELYPYRPFERVRRDVSAMMTVTPFALKTKTTKKKDTKCPPRKDTDTSSSSDQEGYDEEKNEESEENEVDEELIVVLKRWSLAKLHRPEHQSIPTATLQEVRDSYGRWSDEMLKAIRETLLGQQQTQTQTQTQTQSLFTTLSS